MNITITFDITPGLFAAVKSIVDAERPRVPSIDVPDSEPETAVESTEPEKAQNLTAEATVDGGHPEPSEDAEAPKKRKPRAKKAKSESNTQAAPAIGDNSSPAGEAVPERATPEETSAPETAPETAPAPVAEDHASEIVTQDPLEETPAPDPAPAEESPSARAEDPLAGKGQTGEILAELTRKAIGDLDALGVDRGDANRRIRDYCARYEIKFPTFPALLQCVGYADAIEICKGNLK